MPRPRQRSGYARSPRRKTIWIGGISDPANVNPAGQASISLLQNKPTDFNVHGSTVTRILGTVQVWPGDASNITEGVMGIGVVEEDAEAAGSLPDPSTQTGWPWMWWQGFAVGTQATGELSTGESTMFHLDIKAQRRLFNTLAELEFIIDNDDATHTFLFQIRFRVLLKLP